MTLSMPLHATAHPLQEGTHTPLPILSRRALVLDSPSSTGGDSHSTAHPLQEGSHMLLPILYRRADSHHFFAQENCNPSCDAHDMVNNSHTLPQCVQRRRGASSTAAATDAWRKTRAEARDEAAQK